MEDEIDLLINMAGWWTTEEFRKMEFTIPVIPQNLCISAWAADLDSPIVSTNCFREMYGFGNFYLTMF